MIAAAASLACAPDDQFAQASPAQFARRAKSATCAVGQIKCISSRILSGQEGRFGRTSSKRGTGRGGRENADRRAA
jgi:hypothetical protein